MCPGAFPGFNLLKGLRGNDDLHVLSLFALYQGTVLTAGTLLSCYRKICKLTLMTHDEKVVKEIM